jgi:hypothetical protein
MDPEDKIVQRIAELRAKGLQATPRIVWKRQASGAWAYRLQIRMPDKTIEDLAEYRVEGILEATSFGSGKAAALEIIARVRAKLDPLKEKP